MPETFTRAEARALVSVTRRAMKDSNRLSRESAIRDHLIISMALGTGLRCIELAALNCGDIYLELGDTVRMSVILRVFKGSAGGGSTTGQSIRLNDTLRTKLAKYHEWLEGTGRGTLRNQPLFTSNRGDRIAIRSVRRQFKVWQVRAGIETPLGFHALRHTAISNVYRRTKDIRVAQRFARHASIRTTQIYLHPTRDEMDNAVSGLEC